MYVTPALVIWHLMTLVSAAIGILAAREVLVGLRDPELNKSKYGLVYRAMLRGNLLQQLLRLLADVICLGAGIIALFVAPPITPPPPSAAMLTDAVVAALVALRVILTINSSIEFVLSAVWRRDAKYESDRWAAARREHRVALAAAAAASGHPTVLMSDLEVEDRESAPPAPPTASATD